MRLWYRLGSNEAPLPIVDGAHSGLDGIEMTANYDLAIGLAGQGADEIGRFGMRYRLFREAVGIAAHLMEQRFEGGLAIGQFAGYGFQPPLDDLGADCFENDFGGVDWLRHARQRRDQRRCAHQAKHAYSKVNSGVPARGRARVRFRRSPEFPSLEPPPTEPQPPEPRLRRLVSTAS